MTARAALVAAALLAALALAAACGGGGEPDGGAAPRAEEDGAGFGGGYPRYRDEASGLTAVIGTPDLGVGEQRVAFVLSDGEGLVRLPVVSVEASIEGSPTVSALARFHAFPEGVRGLYVAALDFDRPGEWTVEVWYPLPDGTTTGARFPLAVAERPLSPAVGEPAPASVNRTLRDAPAAQLSTGAEPDPELYRLTIAEALAEDRPLVVVFASPGFCTNALCGPQAEVASALRERHGDRANFIHVDLFENPDEVRTGGLDAAIETPLLEEWGLKTDEWTFVIDAGGVVAARFESFAPEAELEAALLAVLGGPAS